MLSHFRAIVKYTAAQTSGVSRDITRHATQTNKISCVLRRSLHNQQTIPWISVIAQLNLSLRSVPTPIHAFGFHTWKEKNGTLTESVCCTSTSACPVYHGPRYISVTVKAIDLKFGVVGNSGPTLLQSS